MPTAVIGVDGGSSKTIALVADLEGRVLGAARGAGSNWSGADVEIPMAVVIRTARQAIEMVGANPEPVLGMFTLAGADWPEDHERRQVVLAQAGLAGWVVVKNDTFGGFRAGSRSTFGVVIAAGTGANTAVIAPDGREWAYGYYQNSGGAWHLAREAIGAVLRAEDGRSGPTRLTRRALDRLGFSCVDDLLRALVADEVDRSNLLSLSPVVFELACGGDEVAAELITRHGLDLAEYATAAIRRFGLQGHLFDLVLAGSLFKGQGPLLIDTITQAVHRMAPYAQVVHSRFEPAVGAVLLAYDALGLPVTDEMYDRLAETCPGAEFFDTASNGSGGVFDGYPTTDPFL